MATAEELSQFSFFTRSSVGEFIRFGSRQVAQHTKPGGSETILPDDEHSALKFCCHGYCERKGRLVATMVTAPDYPPKLVYRLLHQLVVKFEQDHARAESRGADQALSFPALAEYLEKYQDPANADKIAQIKDGLAETQDVLYMTLDQVLQRGQSLESIMEKSDDLSSSSMAFYKTSKKTRCCTIL